MHRASHDLLTEVASQRCQSIQTKEKRILDSALLGNPENQATPLTYLSRHSDALDSDFKAIPMPPKWISFVTTFRGCPEELLARRSSISKGR